MLSEKVVNELVGIRLYAPRQMWGTARLAKVVVKSDVHVPWR